MPTQDSQNIVPATTVASPIPVHSASSGLVQRLIPFHLEEELDTLLYPTNRLIYSPHIIEPACIQPFQEGAKTLIIVNAQNGKTFPATLQALHSSYLVADTQHSMFRRKPGEAMLVVFPLAPHQHCVLQTTIHRVYAFRLELEYHDPRYDVRHVIALSHPVRLSPVPPAMLTALMQHQGHLIRQVTMMPGTSDNAIQRLITDTFYPSETAAPAASSAQEGTPVFCKLHDISLGGACLAVSDDQNLEALTHRLVYLTIPLPPATLTLPDWAYVSLTLQVLGVVRGASHAAAPRALHIRFLKRLLPEVDSLFWHLEEGGAGQV